MMTQVWSEPINEAIILQLSVAFDRAPLISAGVCVCVCTNEQGPEHSSARPERFLQMSKDDPDRYPVSGPSCNASCLWPQVVGNGHTSLIANLFDA